MSCAACANNIEEAIRSVPGVAACSVNFGAEQVAVSYDANKKDVAAIQEAVDAAGYAAQPLQDDGLAPEGVRRSPTRSKVRNGCNNPG